MPGPLRIVHVVRSPIGGIFRHIADLATAQAAAGHAVGLVCDATTGGAFEADAIAALAPALALGATRLPMRRNISPSDFLAVRLVLRHLARLAPDVVHCHGAKGGVYGRLIGSWLGRRGRPIARIYAPHGGSLHYDEHSWEGRFYFGVERRLERFTDAIVHVSAYEQKLYRHKVGAPRCAAAVVRNGLRPEDYLPVAPAPGARDLLYLGMLRDLKGIDVFLEAIAVLAARHDHRASAHVVGQVDDLARYQCMARSFGVADRVTFHDPMPTREAFALANAIVVPSRAESMPYVVLEAIAAGLPIVATRVGGIPEIFGPRFRELVPPDDADALAAALDRLLADPDAARRDAAARRAWLEPRFNLTTMQGAVERLYLEVLGSTQGADPDAKQALRAA